MLLSFVSCFAPEIPINLKNLFSDTMCKDHVSRSINYCISVFNRVKHFSANFYVVTSSTMLGREKYGHNKQRRKNRNSLLKMRQAM